MNPPEALRPSPSSKALRHLLSAEREAGKIPGLPRDTHLRPVRRVGIVGAGTMGGGIAGNRMAEVYMREAEFLLMEGAEPKQIDDAVKALGMAMGPCRMLDMAGVDVGATTVVERGKAGGLADEVGLPTLVDRLAHYAHVRGNRFGYWTPSPLLTSLASSNQHLAGWKPR